MTSKTQELVEKVRNLYGQNREGETEARKMLAALDLDAVAKEVAEKDAEILRLGKESDGWESQSANQCRAREDAESKLVTSQENEAFIQGIYEDLKKTATSANKALRAQVESMRRLVDAAVRVRESLAECDVECDFRAEEKANDKYDDAFDEHESALTAHIEATKGES